MTAKCRIFY